MTALPAVLLVPCERFLAARRARTGSLVPLELAASGAANRDDLRP